MSPRSCTIVAQLNAEWEDMAWRRAVWLDGSPTFGEVLARIRANPDHVLMDLITACQMGYPEAGRIIVQALLPKVILMSASYPNPGAASLTSALWIRISTYPLDRRPRSVAANLLLDAKKDVLRETRAIPVLPLSAFPTPEPTADQVLQQARSLRLATDESLSIVEKVYVEEVPRRQVAHLHNMADATLRRRCCDTVRRLRDHRELLIG